MEYQEIPKDNLETCNKENNNNNNVNNNNDNNNNNNNNNNKDYIEKHERGLITTIRNDTDNTIDERMTTTRKQKWDGNNSMAALNV